MINTKLLNPLNRRQPAPLPLDILRTAQHLRLSPTKLFPDEVIKRSIHIPQLRTTAQPVKCDLNVSIATDAQVPAATEIDHRSIRRLDRRHAVVLNFRIAFCQQLSVRKQRALHSHHSRKAERPQCEIEQMRSEIEHAAAA